MKRNLLSLALTTLVLLPSSPSSSLIEPISDLVGPFDLGEPNHEYNFVYSVNKAYDSVSEVITYTRHGGTIISTVKSAKHAVAADEVVIYPYTFENKSYLTSAGLDVAYSLVNSKTSLKIFNYKYTIYAKSHKDVEPFKIKTRKYTSKTIMYIPNVGSFEETYSFVDLEENFNIYNSLELDVSNLKFSYISKCPLTYDSAEFYFVDNKMLFPKIEENEDGFKHIPLSLFQIDEFVYFKYKDNIFYDPSSGNISFVKTKDSILKNRFYIPRNKTSEVESYTFYFQINNFGGDGINISFPIKFVSYSYYFGLCNQSDYCIMGGIKK